MNGKVTLQYLLIFSSLLTVVATFFSMKLVVRQAFCEGISLIIAFLLVIVDSFLFFVESLQLEIFLGLICDRVPFQTISFFLKSL